MSTLVVQAMAFARGVWPRSRCSGCHGVLPRGEDSGCQVVWPRSGVSGYGGCEGCG